MTIEAQLEDIGHKTANVDFLGISHFHGDLYHFSSEIGKRTVSRWNLSRADTFASIERFEGTIDTLEPVVIVQHDPADIGKPPAFPKSAR